MTQFRIERKDTVQFVRAPNPLEPQLKFQQLSDSLVGATNPLEPQNQNNIQERTLASFWNLLTKSILIELFKHSISV